MDSTSQTNTVVAKALDILDLLAASGSPLPLTDIALSLQYPVSTTHRLLASLASRGYVTQGHHDQLYHLGWKVVVLANSLGSLGQLPSILRPHLKALLNTVSEAVNLSVLSGMSITYLDSLSPPQRISLQAPPGMTVPAYASGMGKVQLAYLPSSEAMGLLGEGPLEAFTPTTITSPGELRAEFDRIRQRGYAMDLGEYSTDLRCIAAPVTDGAGKVVAAVSITLSAGRAEAGWENKHITPLLDACRSMSLELGARRVSAGQASLPAGHVVSGNGEAV